MRLQRVRRGHQLYSVGRPQPVFVRQGFHYLVLHLARPVRKMIPQVPHFQRHNVRLKNQLRNIGGSSGSPVFNSKGQLVGILYGGYSIAGGSTKAVHAKFLKNLYEDYINVRENI